MISKKAKKKNPPKTRRMADVMEMTEIRSRLKMAKARSPVRAFVIRRHIAFPLTQKVSKKQQEK